MPPLRRKVLCDVAAHPFSPTADLARRMQLPWRTVDRLLQELHLLGLLVVDDVPYGAQGKVRWVYSLAGDVSPGTLAKVAGNGASGKGKADER